jgi:4-nitrophenyl phosphatase
LYSDEFGAGENKQAFPGAILRERSREWGSTCDFSGKNRPVIWILDLDGVVWLSEDPVDGSADAIDRMRSNGHRVIFITNNSSPPVETLMEKLHGAGVPAEPADIVTSSQAAASLLEPGETALVCGGPGVVEAVEERGAKAVRNGEADAVVVGFHRDFDYERLTVAFRAIRGGARLIGTNDDATYPTPDGPIPGGGSILAAVATAAGVEPEVAGKPHPPIATLVKERLGVPLDDAVMVGDRPNTDGLMAGRLEVPFFLVLSGVTKEDQLPVEPEPAKVGADLAALVGPSGEVAGDQESA